MHQDGKWLRSYHVYKFCFWVCRNTLHKSVAIPSGRNQVLPIDCSSRNISAACSLRKQSCSSGMSKWKKQSAFLPLSGRLSSPLHPMSIAHHQIEEGLDYAFGFPSFLPLNYLACFVQETCLAFKSTSWCNQDERVNNTVNNSKLQTSGRLDSSRWCILGCLLLNFPQGRCIAQTGFQTNSRSLWTNILFSLCL